MPAEDRDPDERLRALLGAEPPPSVLALTADDRAALADLLYLARRRQAAALAEAFTATLKYVPFPLRKLVRKVLLG